MDLTGGGGGGDVRDRERDLRRAGGVAGAREKWMEEEKEETGWGVGPIDLGLMGPLLGLCWATCPAQSPLILYIFVLYIFLD